MSQGSLLAPYQPQTMNSCILKLNFLLAYRKLHGVCSEELGMRLDIQNVCRGEGDWMGVCVEEGVCKMNTTVCVCGGGGSSLKCRNSSR